ncbi:MAG: hypothetical protein WC208_14110 [Gallionella sp.]|jgi:hypothetical protein
MDKKHEFTKDEIKEIQTAVLDYKDCGMFLHCKTCIPSKIPFGQSAKEFCSYEIATYPLKVGKGVTNIITIWCKHCGKLVWDSRHLRHLY